MTNATWHAFTILSTRNQTRGNTRDSRFDLHFAHPLSSPPERCWLAQGRGEVCLVAARWCISPSISSVWCKPADPTLTTLRTLGGSCSFSGKCSLLQWSSPAHTLYYKYRLDLMAWLCPQMFVPEELERNAIPPHRNRIGGGFLETTETGTKNKRHLRNKWNHMDTALLFSVCFSGWHFYVIFSSSGHLWEAINIYGLCNCYCGNESLWCPCAWGWTPRYAWSWCCDGGLCCWAALGSLSQWFREGKREAWCFEVEIAYIAQVKAVWKGWGHLS